MEQKGETATLLVEYSPVNTEEGAPLRTYCRLSLETPVSGTVRTPIDLTIVLDVSKSMSCHFKYSGEETGLSRMGVVCHALKIILANLGPHDFFSLITFDSTTRLVLPRTQVTPENLDKIHFILSRLEPEGSTNFEDAISTTVRYLQEVPLSLAAEDFLNRHVIVLTDGEPTVGLGTCYSDIPLFVKTVQKVPTVLFHTFGFCCDGLNDYLLRGIANGIYSFVSDPAIVASSFINSLGSLFNQAFTAVEFYPDGKTRYFVPWILQSGPVDLIVDGTVEETLRVVSNRGRNFPVQRKAPPLSSQGYQLRQWLQTKGWARSSKPKGAGLELDLLQTLLDKLEEEGMAVDQEWLSLLRADLNLPGRIKAEYVRSFGRYILGSLVESIGRVYVNNGYEKSNRYLLGPRLREWVQSIELVSKQIAPPNPDFQPYRGLKRKSKRVERMGTERNSETKALPVSYFSSSVGRDFDDGCIDGNCLVETGRGDFVPINQLRPGDYLTVLLYRKDGGHKTRIGVGQIDKIVESTNYYQLDIPVGFPVGKRKLGITSFHPILVEEEWIFPQDHPQASRTYFAEPQILYSLLMKPFNNPEWGSVAVRVEGVWVAHFAHNHPDPKLAHPFYGTDKVRECLNRLDTHNTGVVRITGSVRDEKGVVTDYQGESAFQVVLVTRSTVCV